MLNVYDMVYIVNKDQFNNNRNIILQQWNSIIKKLISESYLHFVIVLKAWIQNK